MQSELQTLLFILFLKYTGISRLTNYLAFKTYVTPPLPYIEFCNSVLLKKANFYT